MNLEQIVRDRARHEEQEEQRRVSKMQMDSRNAICGTLQRRIEDHEWQAIREALVADGYTFTLPWHGVDYSLHHQSGNYGADDCVTLWRKNGSFIERLYSGKDLLLWLSKN